MSATSSCAALHHVAYMIRSSFNGERHLWDPMQTCGSGGLNEGVAGNHLGKTIMSTRPVVDKAPPMVSGTQMNGFLIAYRQLFIHVPSL